MGSERTRILVVDDEEAILETMTFTFEDDYDVLTSTSPREALALLERHAPVAVVISDQRMPEMTGVELLAAVYARHPNTVRIILTGFADMDATIGAINAGHVYAYVTKPWESDQLKQVVRRGVEHHRLARENERLLAELQHANVFLESIVDELDTGALAVDAGGCLRAANRPARSYLGLAGDPRGLPLAQVLAAPELAAVAAAAERLAQAPDPCPEELDLTRAGQRLRLRVSGHPLFDEGGGALGRVIFVREVSHEPIRRRFEELLEQAAREAGPLRPLLQQAQGDLRKLADEAKGSGIGSPAMAEVAERASRSATAIDHWLAVDDALARDDYPDAQLLRERMRVATSRWPLPERLPPRVTELARR
ncbi:MAG TPA: response regulator, partial [Myxococcota bacterium]|nr:response regulator [Myxococcota bacterium]